MPPWDLRNSLPAAKLLFLKCCISLGMSDRHTATECLPPWSLRVQNVKKNSLKYSPIHPVHLQAMGFAPQKRGTTAVLAEAVPRPRAISGRRKKTNLQSGNISTYLDHLQSWTEGGNSTALCLSPSWTRLKLWSLFHQNIPAVSNPDMRTQYPNSSCSWGVSLSWMENAQPVRFSLSKCLRNPQSSTATEGGSSSMNVCCSVSWRGRKLDQIRSISNNWLWSFRKVSSCYLRGDQYIRVQKVQFAFAKSLYMVW